MVHLAALAAVGAVTRAAEPAWTDLEVAQDLHVVRPEPWRAWHAHVDEVMAGPAASPVYRDAANMMAVHWALSAHDVATPWLSAEEARRALDLSLAGSTLALQLSVRDVFAREPVLDVLHKVAENAVSPGMELTRRAGGVRLGVDESVLVRGQALADVEDGVRRPPPSTLRTGATWRLAREDPASTPTGEGEVSWQPALVTYLQGNRFIAQMLRVEVALAASDHRGPELTWLAAVRQDLHPQLALVANLRDDQGAGLPTRAQAGLELRPRPASPWLVRFSRVSARTEGDDARAADRWELSVRSTLGWRLPSSLEQWPLGREPGALGPAMPAVADHGPNALVPLVRQPAWDTAPTAPEPALVSDGGRRR